MNDDKQTYCRTASNVDFWKEERAPRPGGKPRLRLVYPARPSIDGPSNAVCAESSFGQSLRSRLLQALKDASAYWIKNQRRHRSPGKESR